MTFLLEMQANNTISLFCEWNFKYIEGCFVAEQSKTFSWPGLTFYPQENINIVVFSYKLLFS